MFMEACLRGGRGRNNKGVNAEEKGCGGGTKRSDEEEILSDNATLDTVQSKSKI